MEGVKTTLRGDCLYGNGEILKREEYFVGGRGYCLNLFNFKGNKNQNYIIINL